MSMVNRILYVIFWKILNRNVAIFSPHLNINGITMAVKKIQINFQRVLKIIRIVFLILNSNPSSKKLNKTSYAPSQSFCFILFCILSTEQVFRIYSQNIFC